VIDIHFRAFVGKRKKCVHTSYIVLYFWRPNLAVLPQTLVTTSWIPVRCHGLSRLIVWIFSNETCNLESRHNEFRTQVLWAIRRRGITIVLGFFFRTPSPKLKEHTNGSIFVHNS
jgi:hypothetical protein